MEHTDLLPESSLAFVDYLLIAFGIGFGIAYWLRGRVLGKLRRANDELVRAVTRLESQVKAEPPAVEPLRFNRGRSLPRQSQYTQKELSSRSGGAADLPEAAFLRKEISPSLAARQLAALLGTGIPLVSPRQGDDLKRITGIGPRTQEKLHLLGIYSFEQISQLDNHALNLLAAAIEFMPGRLQREDWVVQARQFVIAKKAAAPRQTGNASGKPREGTL